MKRRTAKVGCLIFTAQLLVLLGLYLSFPACKECELQELDTEDLVDTRVIREEDSTSELEVAEETSRGYILALGYYEQQGMAVRNLLQLQCLASSYNNKVVEPFIINSYLGYPFQELSQNSKALKFSQLIDVDEWNTKTDENYGYHGVAKWDEFLEKAPKPLILVCIMYRNPPKIQLPGSQFDWRTGCPESCMNVFEPGVSYLEKHGFKVVRQVCTNFIDYAGAITPEVFLSNILGLEYQAGYVTIMLNKFRGFFGLYRLQITSECGVKHHKVEFPVLPSPRINKDAIKYHKQFLHNKPYIAILVRLERVVLYNKVKVTQCIKQLNELLKHLEIPDVSDTLLTMDVGRYGSKGSTKNNLTHYGQDIIKTIYKNKWSFKSWEQSFEKVAYSKEAAYIANLQRTLASKAECFIMAGGGSFQVQAKELYIKEHPDPDKQCIHTVCIMQPYS